MAELNIEGATIGYDENNMNSTLQNIHNDCVIKAKDKLKTSLDDLRDAVNDCWVGKSAETFKSNLEHDVNKICEGLDEAYNGLEAEFKKVVSGLSEIDNQVVEARKD